MSQLQILANAYP